MKRFGTVSACALGLLVCAGPALADDGEGWSHPFNDQLILFGDSLTDTGNVSTKVQTATGGGMSVPNAKYYYPYASYNPEAGEFVDDPAPMERFSNGAIWAEYLAGELGLGPVVPSVAGGDNFTHGGAQSHSSLPSMTDGVQPPPPIMDMDQQVQLYLDRSNGREVTRGERGDDLFVLFGGSNDFLLAPNEGQQQPNAAQSALRVAGYVHQLHQAGADNFLISNLPSLGEVPAIPDGSLGQMVLNAQSDIFNLTLDKALDYLQWRDRLSHWGRSDLNILRMDTDSLLDSMMENPGEFGLENVDDPAASGLTASGNFQGSAGVDVVENPDEHMFWDNTHPSRITHEWIGQLALDTVLGHASGEDFGRPELGYDPALALELATSGFDLPGLGFGPGSLGFAAVPEPSTLTLAALALGGLATLRRRRRA